MTTPTPSELGEILAAVEKATGPLPERIALTLWCMSAGCTLVEHRNGERNFDGYLDYHVLVDDASGRRNVIVPEWQLPDRSIDAALALVERMLPGCAWEIAKTDEGDDADWFDVIVGQQFAQHKTAPLAIILALLNALRTKETSNANG